MCVCVTGGGGGGGARCLSGQQATSVPVCLLARSDGTKETEAYLPLSWKRAFNGNGLIF